MPGDRPSLRREVERYYRQLAPFLEEDLAAREDRPFWEWVAGEWAGATVLELGAGTGRVTEILAARAARVVALDFCLELVARARRRLATAAAAKLLVADMRGARLAASFDLVAAADDPFSHLIRDRDRDAALAVVARHLAPGGRFLLDALWFPPEVEAAAASAAGRFLERRAPSSGGDLVIREEWHCQAGGRECVARLEYRRRGRVLGEVDLRARPWSAGELRQRLAGAGLEIGALWGGYDRSAWRPEASRRLIVEARRAGTW